MRGLALIACLGLAACGGGFQGGGSAPSAQPNPGGMFSGIFGTRADSDITVTQNQIVIAAPDGFCVDPTGTEDAGTSAFVLMGNCAALSGRTRSAQPAAAAILTASVGEHHGTAVADRLVEMNDYLRSETGRAALSRSGTADTVEVLDSFAQDDVFYLRARDTSPARDPDMAPEYWRAFLDARGSLVTLSVIGTRAAPMNPQTGLEILQSFATLVRTRNGEAVAPPPPVAAAPAPAPAQPAPAAAAPAPAPIWGGLGGIGIFRRLLG